MTEDVNAASPGWRGRASRITSAIAAWCDAHLVSEWRKAHRLWSVWLAGLAGLIGAYFADAGNAAQWTATLVQMPADIRKAMPPLVFAALMFVPTFVRLWNQKRSSSAAPSKPTAGGNG